MNPLIRLAHRLARSAGYDFRRYTVDYWNDLRRAKLVSGKRVDLVLDVGAHEGDYSLELRRLGYRGRIIAFEPLAEAFARLDQLAARDSRLECVRAAVGETDGTAEFNVARHSTSSSLLPVSDSVQRSLAGYSTVERRQVRLGRLDTLLMGRLQEGERVFLKADVQGYERQVLAGAKGILPQVLGMELEVSFVPIYQGSILFPEMVAHLRDLGFRFVNLEPVVVDPATGCLHQADAIFLRDV